ncbi:MAG TPA: hypothetical protein VNF07_09010 [Acidimicrobiales bacterium]|nr:hypothetical protein [Acidimicrobiales bacterium]
MKRALPRGATALRFTRHLFAARRDPIAYARRLALRRLEREEANVGRALLHAMRARR